MPLFIPKVWVNFPTRTTKIDAASLPALEARATAFTTDGVDSQGVSAWEDFRVKQRGAGATMSVDVGLAATNMLVFVANANGGVMRYEYNGSQLNVAITAADGTNPRVDRIVAIAPASVDSVVPQIAVLTGTPTGGATLDNLSGAQAVPTTSTHLADVLVPAGAASIVTGNVRDRRRWPGEGAIPQALFTGATQRIEVMMRPAENIVPVMAAPATPTTHDNFQSAALMYLPNAIAGATRIRWRYGQGGTAATSNYVIAICDPSGRPIVSSGAVAFAGGASSFQEAALTIAATSFDEGYYYVFFGVAALTAASSVTFPGVDPALVVGSKNGPVQRGQMFRLAAGGTTVPTTILSMVDVAGVAVAQAALPVPLIGLSA